MKTLVVLTILLVTFYCTTREKSHKHSVQNLLARNDVPLPEPRPGEWMAEHKETGQSLQTYFSIKPNSPTSDRNVIYLQPVGHFSAAQHQIIGKTASYLQIFFGLKAVVLHPLSDQSFPDSVYRRNEYLDKQILAPYILNAVLKPVVPADGIAFMAITEKDLFPKASWNYVFGLGSFHERTGVTSIYRFQDHKTDSVANQKCLERMIKTVTHEIGHMFTMKHCIHAACLMNGTNSLHETDSRPNRLCSECFAKLHWNLKWKPEERQAALSAYFKEHHLKNEYRLSERDKKVIEKKSS